MVLEVHAPLLGEQIDIQSGASALVGNELSHVKANPAGTHHSDFFSDRLVTFDRVDVAHHFLVINTGNIGHTRVNARRDHHMIEPGCSKLCRINALTEFDGHGVLLEHRAVVTQGLVKLFLARHLLGQIELPAHLIGRIE